MLGEAKQKVRARDEGGSSSSHTVGQEGRKRAGNLSFKNYRKPGNKELGWEMQGQGKDRLVSRFSSSEQDAAGQEAALN